MANDPTASPDNQPLPVLMGRVLADVSDVGKTEKAPANMGGYSFRGIEGILGALKPALGKHGVFCLPEVVERRDTERTVSGSKTMFVVDLRVRWTFHGPAGDTLTAECWGQGTDMGDKSIQKAMTSAFKSMLTQTFCIGDSGTDAERHDVPDTERRNDQEDWFVVNGWPGGKPQHDERRRAVLDSMAALGDEDKATMKEWCEQHGISLRLALTADQFDALHVKATELVSRPGPPVPPPNAPEAAPGPQESATGDPPATLGDLIDQKGGGEHCAQCGEAIEFRPTKATMKPAVGEDGQMYHACHVPFPSDPATDGAAPDPAGPAPTLDPDDCFTCSKCSELIVPGTEIRLGAAHYHPNHTPGTATPREPDDPAAVNPRRRRTPATSG